MQTANQHNTPAQPVLAVDIGGTKTAAALITPEGRIVSRAQEPTRQNGPQDGIQQISGLLENVLHASGHSLGDIAGIGIGIPAVLEPETDFVIWGPNLTDWRNVNLRGALQEYFQKPVCVEYDGHTAVLGEWWLGAGRGHQSMVDIIIGTGIGGGMVLDGHLIRGLNRLAGAVGWFAFHHETADISQQDRSLGFWEARTAGPGIARRAKTLLEGGKYSTSRLANCPQGPSARDVFEAAQDGDALAVQIAHEEADLLGLGIANIVSMVNPEIIILGGSVGTNAGFLIPRITEIVNRYAQPISARSVRIAPSTLGAEAGLLGAAYGMYLRL